MARENQGLQIALIVFVMLTVILAVTAYLAFHNYQVAEARSQHDQADAKEKIEAAEKLRNDAQNLRRLIIGPSRDAVELTGQFNDDMKKYGGAYPEEARDYRPLLEKVFKTLAEKNDELLKVKSDLETFKDQFVKREASKDPQIAGFKKSADDATKRLGDESSKFKTEEDRIRADQAKVHADLVDAQKESKAALEKANAKSADVEGQLTALAKQYDQKSEKLNKMTAETFDVPLGEVRWINQRTGTAWINLGRADSLVRQVSFSVYPADITNLTTSAKKASIEVTQFLGDHSAEARVTEDKTDDPIMPGDKLYSPVWSPNQPRHFALTGLLDIDGDGRSDLATVMHSITMNGGVIDCYLNDKGDIVGHITINTRYLVCGNNFDESGSEAQRKNYATMTVTASKLVL